MRDILEELADGKVSPEEAEKLYDAIMEAGKEDYAQALRLSPTETTAFCHGVGLDELANWRRKGWPALCVKCGLRVEIEKFGWMAKEEGEIRHVLEHITCPIPPH